MKSTAIALLELVLRGEISVKDLVLWLGRKLQQDNVPTELQEREHCRDEFVSFFLSFIREQTLVHIQETQHSGLTPRKPVEKKVAQRELRTLRASSSGQLRNGSSSSLGRSSRCSLHFTRASSDTDTSPGSPGDISALLATRPHNNEGPHVLASANRQSPTQPSSFSCKTVEFKSSRSPLRMEQFIVCSEGMTPQQRKPKNRVRTVVGGRDRSRRDLRDVPKENADSVRNVLDLKDDSEFPPIGASSKRLTSTRRITPTPVSQQNGCLLGNMVLGSSPHGTRSYCGAFCGGDADSETSPDTLNRERELLKQERAKVQSAALHKCRVEMRQTPFGISGRQSIQPINITTLSLEDVTAIHDLDILAELYAHCLSANLFPSVGVELYFLVQLVTIHGKACFQPVIDNDFGLTCFSKAANCVYFAVRSLWLQKRFLLFLDKGTLRLLLENPRVKCFLPKLAVFLKASCENATSVSKQVGTCMPCLLLGGVAFQSDTDNRNNFVNEQGFHLFRKKRDLFYELLREWEANHLVPEWSVSAALGDRVRTLVLFCADPSVLAHLARLFQAQLIMTCKTEGISDRNVPDNNVNVPEPLESLKRSNPEKYKRLVDRFVMPYNGGGPCPPPSFPGHQEFFKDFIVIAGSYAFNQHLVDCLSTKIAELNNFRLSSTDGDFERGREVDADIRDQFFSCLLTLRLLAKFLGFILFLPYRCKERLSEDVQLAQATLRVTTRPVMDLHETLKLAIAMQRTVLVVPWMVELLSMLDPVAPSLPHFHRVLCALHRLYRSCVVPFDDASSVGFNHFFLSVILGWLFEILCDSDSLVVLNDNEDSLPSEKNVDGASEALDTFSFIDKHILYTCCPYLVELRVVLAEFANGNIGRSITVRKITPVATDTASSLPSSLQQLEVQMEENFFHNHPVSMRRTVEFVGERISSNVIKHVRKVVLPSVRTELSVEIRQLAASMAGLGPVEDLSAEVKNSAVRRIRKASLAAADQAHSESIGFMKEFCPCRAQTVLRLLLPDDTSECVVEACTKIVRRAVLKKVSQWFTTHAVADVYYEELVSELQKYLRNIVDAGKVMNRREKPRFLLEAGIVTARGELVPEPADVVHLIKNSCRMLFDVSHSAAVTLDEAAVIVHKLQSVMSKRNNDVTTLVMKTLVLQSVDFAIALVIRCPQVLHENSLDDRLIQLWASHFELSEEFLRMILCTRNVHYMSFSERLETSWAALEQLLVKLLRAGLLSFASLDASVVEIRKAQFSEAVLLQLQKCHQQITEENEKVIKAVSDEVLP